MFNVLIGKGTMGKILDSFIRIYKLLVEVNKS